MSIPKIIHYCWFGKGELPNLEKNCIETWKKILPDYQFMLWNEDSFDVQCCPYVRQAYDHKKFAFVSDYVRIKKLYEYGGIYLDTDIEVLYSFNPFLDCHAFLGFENRQYIGTAMIAVEAHNELAGQMLESYHRIPFIDEHGVMNLTTNVALLNGILIRMGLCANNSRQTVRNIEIYPRDFFFPKKISETEFRITSETICIHRMSGSWLTERQKRRGINKIWINVCRPVLRGVQMLLNKIIGEQRTKKIELLIRNKLK